MHRGTMGMGMAQNSEAMIAILGPITYDLVAFSGNPSVRADQTRALPAQTLEVQRVVQHISVMKSENEASQRG